MDKVLVLALMCCGCSTVDTVNGSALRPEYSDALDVAIDEWNDQLGCVRFARDDLDEKPDLVAREVRSGGYWAAMYYNGRLYIAPDTVGSHAVQAIEHELGHVLDLPHVEDDPTHLMYRWSLELVGGPETTGATCD